jgi:hypothetical protein
MRKEPFTTSDLPLAAFLKLQDYSITQVNTENGRAFFSFDDRTNRGDLILQFFNRKTKVEPLAFLQQIRDLKSLIRQNGMPIRPRESARVGGHRQ